MWKALKGPFFGLLATGFLTYATYGMAVTLAAGGQVNTSGRRGLYKQLLAGVAEALGPAGVLVAGGLVAAAFVAWGVAALRKPAKPPA